MKRYRLSCPLPLGKRLVEDLSPMRLLWVNQDVPVSSPIAVFPKGVLAYAISHEPIPTVHQRPHIGKMELARTWPTPRGLHFKGHRPESEAASSPQLPRPSIEHPALCLLPKFFFDWSSVDWLLRCSTVESGGLAHSLSSDPSPSPSRHRNDQDNPPMLSR